MKRTRTPREWTDAVLVRINAALQAAQDAGDTAAVANYRVAWMWVYLAGYASAQCVARDLAPLNVAQPQLVAPRDGGRAPKAAPLRLVVAREQVLVRIYPPPHHQHRGTRDILECGHRMELRIPFFDEKPARRRRCSECGQQRAAVERLTIPLKAVRV